MKLQTLLLAVASFFTCTAPISAQSVLGEFPDGTQHRLQPANTVETDAVTTPKSKARAIALRNLQEATAQFQTATFPAAEMAQRIETSENKKLRLDSLVQTNPDGSNYLRMACTYNEQGLMTRQVNSLWDSTTGQWADVEEYNYEWDEYGYCLMQSMYGYGSGEKIEYKYNDRHLGIEQILYTAGADKVWKELTRGVYEYDDAGNIVDELTYFWENNEWKQATHNTATWDSEHRQTSYESYEWQNGEWSGVSKEEYSWYTDNKLYYKYMYRWMPETRTWQNAQRFLQDWDSEGRLTAQRMRYWNADRQDWTGEYPSWGTNTLLSYDAIIEYDEKGRTVLQDHREWHEAGSVIFSASKMVTEWTDYSDGTYDGEMNAYLYTYGSDDEQWNQRQRTRYNAQDSLVWDFQELADYSGTMMPYYEDKYDYDDRGNQTYYASWTFENGERKPSLEERDTYDTDNNIIEQFFRQPAGDGMIPMGIPSNLRHGPGYEDSDDEGWVNSSHFTYKYENGIRIEKMNWRWDTNLNDWTASAGSRVEYDWDVKAEDMILPLTWEDPYKINYMDEYAGNGDGEWNISRKHYYYSETQAATAVMSADAEISFADNTLQIDTQSDDIDNRVFDLSGKLVYSGNAQEENLSHLTDGIYIVRSVIDGNSHVLKIIIAH